jgi:hypothetical protein
LKFRKFGNIAIRQTKYPLNTIYAQAIPQSQIIAKIISSANPADEADPIAYAGI